MCFPLTAISMVLDDLELL